MVVAGVLGRGCSGLGGAEAPPQLVDLLAEGAGGLRGRRRPKEMRDTYIPGMPATCVRTLKRMLHPRHNKGSSGLATQSDSLHIVPAGPPGSMA